VSDLQDDAVTRMPAGGRVGPYRFRSELGRGGMGTVYLAERADDAFEKLVALKVVKRGMDTDEVLQRFRYERQILASLEHPNIGRLYDGGATEDGRPHPDVQTCIMNARVIRAIAGARENWAPAGDNLFLDLDLSPANLPPGTRLRLGEAELVIALLNLAGGNRNGHGIFSRLRDSFGR
jgi:serine/threonine protein kinase